MRCSIAPHVAMPCSISLPVPAAQFWPQKRLAAKPTASSLNPVISTSPSCAGSTPPSATPCSMAIAAPLAKSLLSAWKSIALRRTRRATMPKRNSDRSGAYAVGYGRPPQSTRFKPGVSGNPNGKPKGSRPVGAVLQDIIQQKIAVTENGKTRRLPVLEIMLRRLANEAMRGEQRSIKFLLSLLEHYGDSSQTTLQLSEMLAEDAEILTEYLDETTVAESQPSPTKQEGEP